MLRFFEVYIFFSGCKQVVWVLGEFDWVKHEDNVKLILYIKLLFDFVVYNYID